MIKTFLFFLALAFMLTYLAGTKITFKPFSIRFTSPSMAIGVLLIAIGLALCYSSFYRKGYSHGQEEAKNNIVGPVKKIQP